MAEHTVYVKSPDDEGWTELSKFATREDALSELRRVLVSEEEPWTEARIDPAGDRYVLTPQRAVHEVMTD